MPLRDPDLAVGASGLKPVAPALARAGVSVRSAQSFTYPRRGAPVGEPDERSGLDLTPLRRLKEVCFHYA